jgi:hypothetical protein
LEPAVVSTLYTGIGPIAVLILAFAGIAAIHGARVDPLEGAGHLGVLFALVAIAIDSASGQSGFAGQSTGLRLAGLAAAIFGGVTIAISHLIARCLNDLGIGSVSLMGLRFPFAPVLALGAETIFGQSGLRPSAGNLPLLALAAFVLVVVPSFVPQLGVARPSPLAVNVLRSLGPNFVLAVQQLDGRLRFSAATLVCVLLFMVFALLTGVTRSWAEARGSRT